MTRMRALRLLALAVLVSLPVSAELKSVEIGGATIFPFYYRVNDVSFKPYVEKLYTQSGTNILRDAPADHLHHHGLMFAIRINGVNFWEEKPDSGKQVHVSAQPDGGKAQTYVEKLRWTSQDGVVVEETRTIAGYSEAGVTLLTWQSALHGIDGKPVPNYHGSNYNGLGMRFLESMDKGGTFFNADGGTGVAGTVGSKSNWCAYSANADGKPVTVAMFDHPTNVRAPATWYTMDTPFAYLSATLALDKEPLQAMNLVLTYGVAAWDGTTPKEKVEEVYQQWLKLVEPLVASAAPAK
ncbi:MAG: hypothetical protein FJY92_03880 [Candidatus Hydrogenedentes bacterium]|nr:hypothetical protein [Candidatus Hydrogenedentota bacterium]